jgi:hypothetical protein
MSPGGIWVFRSWRVGKDYLVSGGKLLTLSDFDWASAASYIIYVSGVAGLREINSNHVISFPLARLGPVGLLKQKTRVLALLEGNRESVERFVGEYKVSLGKRELAILRTMYLQYKDNIQTVKGHIEVIGICVAEVELDLLRFGEGGEDETLF